MRIRNKLYTIKEEREGLIQMTYEDLVSHIKRGFDFRFSVGNNIEISVFNYSADKEDYFPKTSVLCYSLMNNNEQIDITDVVFNKSEIETIEIFKYMTLKELYNTNEFKILEMF